MAVPLLVGPRERHHDAVTVRIDRVEAVVTIAERPPLRDSDLENLTGLLRAVSGERTPESPQPAPAPPLQLGMDQGDEGLYVTRSKRLVRGPNRIDAHTGKATPKLPV